MGKLRGSRGWGDPDEGQTPVIWGRRLKGASERRRLSRGQEEGNLRAPQAGGPTKEAREPQLVGMGHLAGRSRVGS